MLYLHTSIKELALHKLFSTQLLQPYCHHLYPISIHCWTQEAEFDSPQATQLSSKPPHEVKDSWLLLPKALQGYFLCGDIAWPQKPTS